MKSVWKPIYVEMQYFIVFSIRPFGICYEYYKSGGMKFIRKPIYVEVQHFIVFSIRPFGICYEYYKTEFFHCLRVFPFFRFGWNF
jgi:hypothetical protein